MPYVVIEDFRAGLDRRKMPESSPQGSLQGLVNAHITRGGEIEKRRGFIPIYSLPPGQTFGLAGANGVLTTFGSEDAPAVPPGVSYQRLVDPAGSAMNRLVRAEFYDGLIWAIAKYASGAKIPFYNGARIEDFDAGSGAFADGKQPEWALTFNDKVYTIFDSVTGFSGIDEPTDFNTATGAGFKNMANQTAGSEKLTALGLYQNLVAVFAQRNIQTWFFDPDPLQNVKRQVLPNIGTVSPRSVVSLGEVDVFFLAANGVRSLRARDSSNQAGVSDVGTPIDELVTDYMATLSEAEIAAAAGVIDPKDGRYILTLADRAYAFSYFASSRISAWSTYELGFRVDDFVSMDDRVWARGGDTVYLFGGLTGREYDTAPVEVKLPYIDARQIASFKNWTGFDIVCEGEWEIWVSTDPQNPLSETKIGTINGTTINALRHGVFTNAPLLQFRLTHNSNGPARLSKIIAHYEAGEVS